ncbi:MAG: CSLREA domain-containing protein, partial [Myxococcales bacterium]|nr:CSLREA domain-containing protein [Myxococcales bacterium]
MRRRIGAILVLLTVAALAPGGVEATTIAVTTPADELNADGDCALREAIEAANTDAPVDACAAGNGLDTISIPAGTYLLAIPGADEDANATGDLDVTASVTITGAGEAMTILDGAGLDRVLDVDPAQAGTLDVAISGLTVPGGVGGIRSFGSVAITDVTARDNTGATLGGGVYCLLGSAAQTAALARVTLLNNEATDDGGGLHVGAEEGHVVVTDVEARDNVAGASGGGVSIATNFETPAEGSVSVERLTAMGNRASQDGGGLQVGGRLDNAILRDLTLTDNVANDGGGGLHLLARTRDPAAVLERVTATGNTGGAMGGGGLAIRCVDCGPAMTDLTARDNTTSGAGGGIQLFAVTAPDFPRLILTGNSAAGSGGGLAMRAVDGGVMTDLDCADNTATGDGGCLWIQTQVAPLLIRGAFARNHAGGNPPLLEVPDDPLYVGGGALYVDARTVSIQATTFDANTTAKQGGAIAANASSFAIADTAFTGNEATGFGGAIWGLFGDLLLARTRFVMNASDQSGGAFSGELGILDARGASFDANSAGGDGGALEGSLPFAYLHGCAFSGNSAGGAGGAVAAQTIGLELVNATLSANTAGTQGGALALRDYEDPEGGFTFETAASVDHATFAGNAAPLGGALFYPTDGLGDVTLRSTIVDPGVQGADCDGRIASAGHNLDRDGSCGFAEPGDQSHVDPRLAPLADNGG